MAKSKILTEEDQAKAGFYKGYDIKWLKEVREDHPEGHLVDEFEKEYPIKTVSNEEVDIE